MNKMTKLAKSHWRQLLAALTAMVVLILLLTLAQCSSGTNAAAGTQSIESAAESSSYEQPEIPTESSVTTASVTSMTSEDSSDPRPVESVPENAQVSESAAAPSNETPTSATSSIDMASPVGNDVAPAASSNNPAPTQEKRWVEDTEQVWVVDSEAWTEQIPIYDSQERSVCNICGADITGHTAEHGKAHMLAGEGSGHHSEVRQVLVGYDEIEHAEQGNYETVVTGGHWE